MLNATAAVSPTRSLLVAFGERLWFFGLFFVPLLADLFAQAPYYGLQTRLYPSSVLVACFFAAFLLLVLFVTPSQQVLEAFGGVWQRRGLMLLCFGCAAMAFPFIGGTPSVPLRIVFGVLGLIFVGLLLRAPSLLWVFLLALLYSFIQRARFLNAVAIQTEFSDILPTIALAVKNFLAGHPVYVTYYLPSPFPLVYLPVTWLSYVPPIVLGLDMRLTNLVLELGIALVFLSLVYPARHLPAVNLALGYAAFLFVLPTAMFWDSFSSHPIWWFWVVVGIRFLIARRYILWAIAMGVTLASSQLALVVLPVMGLYVLREIGWARAILCFLIIGGVTVAIVLPFFLPDPQQFVRDTILWFSDLKNYGLVVWNQDHRWQYVLGFGGEAWRRGFADSLRYVQAAIVLVFAAIYLLRFPNAILNVLRVIAVTLGFFLLFSAVVWHYYYQAMFYLLLFYVALLTIQTRPQADGAISI